MKYKSSKFIAALCGMGFALTQLQGQTVANGDLILFFQKPGDNNTVYVNLGKAATLFRGAASGPSAAQQRLNFININTTLNNAFSPSNPGGWASDPDLFAGLAGVFSNIDSPTIVDGDQYRTLYASKARNSVGTVGSSGSTQWNLDSAGSLTNGATNMLALTTNFAFRLPGQNQGVVSVVDSVIDNQNPTSLTGVQGQAFGQFNGGVQQRGSASTIGTFGDAGVVEFALDLQRLVPDGTVDLGEVEGPRRKGTYEGTVTVATNGNVSFITQGVAGATVCVDNITTTAGTNANTKKVTIAFTATGNVDVYSSTDLQTWGAAISTNVAASPFILDNIADDKRFFVLVPAGQPYPPTP